MAGEGFTPISLGDLSIRWRGEGLHVAQEAAYGQEVAQGFAVIVAGQPGFAVFAFVDLGVVPPELPGGIRTTSLGGALRLDEAIHTLKCMSAGRPRGKSPGDGDDVTRFRTLRILPAEVPVPAYRAERSNPAGHGQAHRRRVMRHHEHALRSVV